MYETFFDTYYAWSFYEISDKPDFLYKNSVLQSVLKSISCPEFGSLDDDDEVSGECLQCTSIWSCDQTVFFSW